jgi:hypothetical protein
MGTSAAGNNGINVNTNDIKLLGTGSDTWLFVSGALNGNDRVTFGGVVVISGTLYDGSGNAYTPGGGGGGSGSVGNWKELSPSPRLNTTASVSIAGGLGAAYAAQSAGTDVFFFVSGSVAGAGVTGTSVIGGDLVTSGSLFAKNGIADVSSNSSNSLLRLTSNANSIELTESTSGNFSLRNLAAGGQFVASVKTSAGVTSNFMDVRPNGSLTGSVISIFPSSIYAGAANPFNSSDTTFFVAGKNGAKGGNTRGTSVFGGDTVISGSAYLGTTTSDSLVLNGLLASDIIPDGNRTRNLGSNTSRFANVYTGDLHLKNERGDYTLIEEEDCLTIRFNKTGKRYKFVLEPAPEFDD